MVKNGRRRLWRFKNQGEKVNLNTIQGGIIVAIFLCTFLIPGGYNYGMLALLITGIIAIAEKSPHRLSYFERRWIAFLLIFSAISLTLRLLHGEPLSTYDNLSRYGLSIILLYGLSRYPPAEKYYSWALLAGTLTALLMVLVARYRGDSAIGYQHHIQFSGISMIFAVFSGFRLPYAKTRWQRFILIVALFCGVCAAALGGGRGSWLIVPPILVLFFIMMRKRVTLKNAALGFFLLLSFFSALYCIPQTGVAARVRGVFSDLDHYRQGTVATSQGMRLEMWRCARLMWQEKPLMGWGSVGMQAEKARLIARNDCHFSIAPFNHLHNDYIDIGVRYGIVGCFNFLFIYCGALFLYFVMLAQFPSIAWQGIAINCCFMVVSLTNAFLSHHISIIFYLLLNSLLFIQTNYTYIQNKNYISNKI